MKSFIVNLFKTKILVGRLRAIVVIIRYPLRAWIYSIASKFALNVVNRKELSSNNEKYHILHFGVEESVLVSEPNSKLNELPSFIKKKIGTILTWEQPFVSEVANAEIVGSTAIGFDRESNLIAETTNPYNLARGLPIRTLLLKNLPTWRFLEQDTVCSLVCGHRNYYHWLTESLTRIEGLEYYQEHIGRKSALIIDANLSKWQIESLRLLGYEPDDCLRWNWSKIKVKRLVIPSFRRKGTISPTTCRWLRDRLVSNLPDLGSKKPLFSSRIYISRAKTAGRRVINEDDVLEALKPFGFVAYTLEEMSFTDQVRLFSQAEIVVAAHGAGLTNIMFAQNLKVIELFGSYGDAAYFILSKVLGFDYGCLWLGDEEKNLPGEKYNGIVIDIAKLRALVEEMLNIEYGDRQPASTAF
jgi:hypothetical protein